RTGSKRSIRSSERRTSSTGESSRRAIRRDCSAAPSSRTSSDMASSFGETQVGQPGARLLVLRLQMLGCLGVALEDILPVIEGEVLAPFLALRELGERLLPPCDLRGREARRRDDGGPPHRHDVDAGFAQRGYLAEVAAQA